MGGWRERGRLESFSVGGRLKPTDFIASVPFSVDRESGSN